MPYVRPASRSVYPSSAGHGSNEHLLSHLTDLGVGQPGSL
jgi:hypothetical protein